MNKSKLKRMKRDQEKQRVAVERGYAKALQQSKRYFGGRIVDEVTPLKTRRAS